VILNRAGREFAHWAYVADVTITSVEVYLAGAWRTATVTATDISVLVSGPDTTGFVPDGTVTLPLGVTRALVRFPDNPELPVRDGGTITVTD